MFKLSIDCSADGSGARSRADPPGQPGSPARADGSDAGNPPDQPGSAAAAGGNVEHPLPRAKVDGFAEIFGNDLERCPDLRVVARGPGLALHLLEAGYVEGSDGVYEHPQDGRLSLRVGTTGGNKLREDQQQIIQQQLAQIGVDATIKMVDFRNLWTGVFSGEITPAQYNEAWNGLMLKYQGLVPPGPRPANAFDPSPAPTASTSTSDSGAHARSRSSPRIQWMPSGSRPLAGSSRMSSRGSASSACAIPSRWRMPSE